MECNHQMFPCFKDEKVFIPSSLYQTYAANQTGTGKKLAVVDTRSSECQRKKNFGLPVGRRKDRHPSQLNGTESGADTRETIWRDQTGAFKQMPSEVQLILPRSMKDNCGWHNKLEARFLSGRHALHLSATFLQHLPCTEEAQSAVL